MIKLDDREVYKVGFLRDIGWYLKFRKALKGKDGVARNQFISSVKLSWRHKSYWNGYLAEPYEFPWLLETCGHGWTKRRAVGRLNKYCKRDDVFERYVYERLS